MKTMLFAFICILNSTQLFGVVNYRNGNYYQEFTDLSVSIEKQHGLTFKRTYNSASSFEGILGKGWGTTFETTVEILPNTVVVKEMGNGKIHLFVPKGISIEKNLEASLQMLKDKNNLKDDAFTKYKNRLLLEPQALLDEVGGISKNSTATDGEYINSNEPDQKVIVKNQEISFLDSEGSNWNFDKQGKIKGFTHKSGLRFNAVYENGQLSSLSAPKFFIQFSRTPQGVLAAVQFGQHIANYKIEKGQLLQSVDQNKETYTYEYEQGRLSKISGKDFREQIKYSPETGEVRSVTDINDKESIYKFYSINNPNPVRHVEIKRTSEPLMVYEYEDRVGKNGPYLYRRLIQRGKNKQQVIYDDCCGRPLQVIEGEKKSEFKYNERGLPISLIEADGKTHSWTWNENGDLNSYKTNDDERTYKYDSYGMVHVISKKSGQMTLVRNANGKITESVVTSKDGIKKDYKFVYSPDGKSMAMVTAKGQKVFLKENMPGNWEVDASKSNDLKAKLDFLSWLHKYQELVIPPQPQAWMPTF